jgi:hypothetical protein
MVQRLACGLNATEVTSYQYLGMTKIAGALNMLPTTMLRYHAINPSVSKAIKIYRADGVAVRVDGESLLPITTVCLV